MSISLLCCVSCVLLHRPQPCVLLPTWHLLAATPWLQDNGVPARLRGRLGSGGGLLGAALKEIAHEHQHEPQRERHEPVAARDGGGGARQGRGDGNREERQAEEPRREVREVREVHEGRDRRGGRSRR